MKSIFNLVLVLSILFCMNTQGDSRAELGNEKGGKNPAVLTKASSLHDVFFSDADLREETEEETEEESSVCRSHNHDILFMGMISLFELYDAKKQTLNKRGKSALSYSSTLTVNVRSVIFLI